MAHLSFSRPAPDRGLTRQIVLLRQSDRMKSLQLFVGDGEPKYICGLVAVPVVSVRHMYAVLVLVGPVWIICCGRVHGDSSIGSRLVSPCRIEPIITLRFRGILILPTGVEGLC